MRIAMALAAVVAVGLVFGASSDAEARSKKHSGLKAWTTVGENWTFKVTEVEPGGRVSERTEIWKVAEVERFGKAKRVIVVMSEVGEEGSMSDRQLEYVVDGTKFHDMSRLEKGRRVPDFAPEDLAERIPLFDTSKAGKEAKVSRYPDNALAYVRYQKVGKYTPPGGKEFKDVIHATRRRGDTETQSEWWYSPKQGLVAIKLTLPAIAGGTTMTWSRTDDYVDPNAEPTDSGKKKRRRKKK